MAARRTFTAKPPTPGRTGPEFDLEGVGQITGKEWSEHFTCVPTAPSGVLDDLASSMGTDGRGNTVWNQVSLLAFFRGVLLDDDVVRFQALVHDKDRLVELDLLGEIMLWVADEVVGHPTQRPSS